MKNCQGLGDTIVLNAYMASGLTNLTADQMQMVEFISDKVATVCRSNGIELYEPRKKTSPDRHKDVPAVDVYYTDRERVATSDLVLLLADYASHGAGMEMEIAAMAGVPVLVLVTRGKKVTRMVLGSFIHVGTIEYDDPEGLEAELGEKLRSIVPNLRERRKIINVSQAELGKRIAKLRHASHMERSELAKALGINKSYIEALEEKPDKVSNPSYFLLQQIARQLKTTVAYLTEGYSLDKIVSDPVLMTSLSNLQKFQLRKNLQPEISIQLWSQFQEDIEAALSSAAAARRSPVSEADWEKRYEALMQQPLWGT